MSRSNATSNEKHDIGIVSLDEHLDKSLYEGPGLEWMGTILWNIQNEIIHQGEKK